MKTDFEERKERRIENAKRLAEKNEQLQESLLKQGDRIFAQMNGQPILIGHHSEKRHRREIERGHNIIRRGLEAGKKAKYYEEKAVTIATSNTISSDDPKALEKLRAKLQTLEDWQESMKGINKIVKNTKFNDAQKVEALVNFGIPEEKTYKLLAPDFCGRIGFSYHLTNNNGNMKRIKDRIKQLESIEKLVTAEITINGIRIVQNVEANRLQMFFPGKPEEAVRNDLKRSGFRWSPNEGAWQRQINNNATYQAKRIANGTNLANPPSA